MLEKISEWRKATPKETVDSMYLEYISEARSVSEHFSLQTQIGLSTYDDRHMFNLYLAERMVRLKAYDSSWLLSQPETLAMAKIPGLSWLVREVDRLDRDRREVEHRFKKAQQEKINIDFNTPEAKTFFRAIELSVNDLVARGMQEDLKNTETKFELTSEIVSDWAAKWREEISVRSICPFCICSRQDYHLCK